MTTLADVRARALGPVLYGHVMPTGVLHSLGMAEHPVGSGDADGAGNGYLQALRTLPTARYDIFTAPRVANFGEATYTTGARMTALKAAICTHAAAKITLPGDVTDATIGYNRGTSFSAQGAVFAPVGTSAPYAAYDYSGELAALKAALGTRRLYAGIGAANNHLFPTGNFDFNNDYPLKVRKFSANFYAAAALIDQAAEDIDPLKDWIGNVSLICADMVARDWLAACYDPTHPDVFALMMQSIADLVTALGTTVEYVCQGESGLAHTNFASDQAPVTHYTDNVIAGFRSWMTDIKGFTVAELNDRWGTTFPMSTLVDPRDDAFLINGVGMNDYQKWLNFTLREVALQTYHKVKATNAAARGSFGGFGVTSMELGGLQAEFGTAADFYGENDATYLAQKRYHLQNIAAACRLSGLPGNWHATTPPGIHVPNPPDPGGGIPELLWARFNFTRDQFNWLMRDVLVSGSVHIGYLRTVGFSFRQHADSVTAIYGGMEALATIRAASLEGMGAYQRYAIHITDVTSPLHEDNQNTETTSAGVARKLHEKLRETHTPAATFSMRRTMDRTISQWWLKRSFVVVPYNIDRMELIAEYADLFPDGAAGAAVFLDEDADMPAGFQSSSPTSITEMGSLHRIVRSNGDVLNCWSFRCRDRRACKTLDQHYTKVAEAIETVIRPIVQQEIAQSATDPFIVSPLRMTTMANGTDPVSQVVSDGLNFTVAVSNMGSSASSTTITVDPKLATALDVTYPAATVVNLNALETKFVTIQATSSFNTGDIQGFIADAVAGLADASIATYDATIKTAIGDLLTKAEAQRVATNLGRALALYLEAVRTPILKATYAANSVTINARRLGLPAEAAVIALTGARVQLVWPLNGREEQAVEGVTNGSGDVAVAVGSPAERRWDFATSTFVAPAASARAQCEAHVTDLTTGATSKVAFVVA